MTVHEACEILMSAGRDGIARVVHIRGGAG